MEYIIVFDADSKAHAVLEDGHYFLEKFSAYEDAIKEAEKWKEAGDCKSFSVYGLCTDERNYII